ncbi:G2 M phase-specific E3 ubiquitin- ligase, partial [Paramuricea clavata]
MDYHGMSRSLQMAKWALYSYLKCLQFAGTGLTQTNAVQVAGFLTANTSTANTSTANTSTANTSTANTSTVRTPNTSTAYSSTVRTSLLSEQQRVNTPNNTNLHNRALEEHRRLFGFSGQLIVSSTSQSNGKRSRGKGGKNGKSAKKPKVATWTHAFVCLAKRTQVLLLTPRERYELKSAGIGEKKITVEIKDKGFEDLYSIPLQEFPLLSHAGGIELMRTGFAARSKTLEVIPVPTGSSSYSIQYLKEVLQQAKCYVRPIQKDLPVVIPHDCQGNLNTSTNEESSCPREQCRLCLKSIPILQMRRHMWSCEITESSFSVEPEIICESDEESNSIPESLPHSESPSTSGSSSMVSYMEPGIDELRKIFPDPPNQVLVEAMLKGGTVEEAINILLDQTTTDHSKFIQDESDLAEIMFGLKEDLPIDEIQKFLGEAGVDAGGLSREYGLILRKEIFSSNANLFEGKQTRKLPIYNINGIQSNLYYLAGKMVAYLIIHLDIGIPMLSPAFYYYLVSKDIEKASEYCCIEDVPDHETKEWINQ